VRRTCTVKVQAAEKCVVSVDNYYTIMVAPAPVTLEFELVGNGSFATTGGVFFKSAAGQKVFRQMPGATPTKISFRNNKTNGIYEYGVRVKQGDTACPVLDPTSINDMGSEGFSDAATDGGR
jgi:hypothetical protein